MESIPKPAMINQRKPKNLRKMIIKEKLKELNVYMNEAQ